jgi:DNA polymerase
MIDLDFETYSEVDLPTEGVARYVQHPSAKVLMLGYNLHDGFGPVLWLPYMPPPTDLFARLAAGDWWAAHNAAFELEVWHHICVARMGWPSVLHVERCLCTQARALAYCLPKSLDNVCQVLGTAPKDPRGKALIKLFCMPNKPTKARTLSLPIPGSSKVRYTLDMYPQEAQEFGEYCMQDVVAEDGIAQRMPYLSQQELAFHHSTLRTNIRGLALDLPSVQAAADLLTEALQAADEEVKFLTGGEVETVGQVSKIVAWLRKWGIHTDGLKADQLDDLLSIKNMHQTPRRVLELRKSAGSAGVKKVFTMLARVDSRGRVPHLYTYHGARTGRDTAEAVQPQNMTKKGPDLRWCEDMHCKRPYARALQVCPWCGTSEAFSKVGEWSYKAVEFALDCIRQGYRQTAAIFGDPILTVSGCIRGLFVAGPGMELVCSDYASIESVVTAVLAGEEWRIQAFREKKDIYLVSASKITGVSLDEYTTYALEHGTKHPHRQKIGKPAELALGFQGWVGAWRNFDDSDTFTDDQVKDNIKAWRAASPMIVELWGGQVRGLPWDPTSFELFGLEGAIVAALKWPGTRYTYRLISYEYDGRADVLLCYLPSGRAITYHRPRFLPPCDHKKPGQGKIVYEGWNSDSSKGAVGWKVMDLYGGRATENVVQGTARDVMAHGALNVEAAGYPVVLRTHDELASEVPEGRGNVDEYEALMGDLPPWAKGWPIRAAGGYIAKRYRKD